MTILAAVEKCLNKSEICAELSNDVLENMQYSRRPTINLVIPSYFELSTMGAVEEQDTLEIARLKAGREVFSSITQFLWIANFLNPGFYYGCSISSDH